MSRLVRSSGTQRVRPTGARFAVALTVENRDGDLRIVTHTIRGYSVHEAMRLAQRQTDLAPGEHIAGATGARVSPTRKRGRKVTPTLSATIDWDAIESGRHGLAYIPNR